MRLWHIKLISKIDNQRLLGQHRECAALRGQGWGKKHSIVNYVFNYSYMLLYYYHKIVMYEMTCRGFHPNTNWYNVTYRGKKLGFVSTFDLPNWNINNEQFYLEHNDCYLNECKQLLLDKNFDYYKNIFKELV